MPNLKWSDLKPLQLGRYAESYAKMEFLSYGFEVYSPEVDDHGVDFIAKHDGTFFEVQVKSVRKNHYMYIRQDNIISSDRFLICYMQFRDGSLPDVYIFPATVWDNPNSLFVSRPYGKPGQKSKAEYGISFSRKNAPLLDKYRVDNFFKMV